MRSRALALIAPPPPPPSGRMFKNHSREKTMFNNWPAGNVREIRNTRASARARADTPPTFPGILLHAGMLLMLTGGGGGGVCVWGVGSHQRGGRRSRCGDVSGNLTSLTGNAEYRGKDGRRHRHGDEEDLKKNKKTPDLSLMPDPRCHGYQSPP